MSNTIPANLRYTKDHEWARQDGDHVVVGITEHAVDQLGDITLVTLPSVGTAVTKGERFGDVDSVKAVSELYAPLSGEVVEVNSQLASTPELINSEPYQGGWMLKIRPHSSQDFAELLSAEQYTASLASLD